MHSNSWSWGVFFAITSVVLLAPIAVIYFGGLIDLWSTGSGVVGYINAGSLVSASLGGFIAYIVRDRENV